MKKRQPEFFKKKRGCLFLGDEKIDTVLAVADITGAQAKYLLKEWKKPYSR